MIEILKTTLIGIIRDRLLQGVMALCALIIFIPTVASLSMRQVTELSITLSLSLISFVMLLLSVFLGATSIWKDIDRRYTFSILSLPISRTGYILGRFFGISIFLFFSSLILCLFSVASIKFAISIYPPSRSVAWDVIVTAVLFNAMKYVLLVAVAMLFSTVSTSFFLPVFGTISVYFVGTISQQVYDYLHTPSAMKSVSNVVKQAALGLYYLLPNLSAFDLKLNAIYSLPLDAGGLAITTVYFVVYTFLLLALAAFVFERREMK